MRAQTGKTLFRSERRVLMKQKRVRILREAIKANIRVLRVKLPQGVRAAYVCHDGDKVIAIDAALPPREALGSLAMELGFDNTSSSTNMLYTPLDEATRRLSQAYAWALERLLPLDLLADAFLAYDANIPAMADALNLPVDFLEQAFSHYRARYGASCETCHHRVSFIPWFSAEPKI